MTTYRWIPISEGLPVKAGVYVVYAESCDEDKPFIMPAWYEPESGFDVVEAWKEALTHWMPLPPPPMTEHSRMRAGVN